MFNVNSMPSPRQYPEDRWQPRFSWIFDRVTYYKRLRTAQHDEQFNNIHSALVVEWRVVAGFLLAVTEANLIILYKASRGVEVAEALVASQLPRASLASAAMGLFQLACILIRRVIIREETFAEYAYDKYWETFLSFAITSRLPLLCLCISMVPLAFCLVPVGFAAYPYETIALFVSCGVSVALAELDYIYTGIDMSIRGVRWAVRIMLVGFRAVCERIAIEH